MATEATLQRDGAQCVAAANYYNPSSALPGPNGSGQFLAVYISAARTVSILATQGANAYGVLQNTPVQGQAADVGLVGISKWVAGAAFAAGATLMSDNQGRAIAWTSSNTAVGVALEAATAAGQVVTTAISPLPN